MQIIRRYPFVGISLAVACGLVLAHVVNEALDYLWLNFLWDFLAQNGWMLGDLAAAAGVLYLVLRRRRGILAWARGHMRWIAVGVFSFWAICSLLILLNAHRFVAMTPLPAR
jgi:hypothetical protein